MKTKLINGVQVTWTANIPDSEVMEYIKYVDAKSKQQLKKLSIILDGDEVELSYEFEAVKFDRIRRITGYLTGTMDTWNNAKTSELTDRVTHGGLEKI